MKVRGILKMTNSREATMVSVIQSLKKLNIIVL